VALHLEQYETAQAHYEEAYALAQEIENQMLMTICQVNLGEVLHHSKHYEMALRYYRDGLKSLIGFGDKLSIIATVESIAYLLIDLTQAATGVQILSAAAVMRQALGAPIAPREKPREEAYRAQAARQLGEADYKTASAQGERLSLDEVTAFVLEM
jgi:tetratricopeptide (TPR) repeat protein